MHRGRHRRIPKWYLIAAVTLITATAALVTFVWQRHASHSAATGAASEPATSNLFATSPHPNTLGTTRGGRPVYPYSVVEGGTHNGKELAKAITNDHVVKDHYSDFDVAKTRVITLSSSRRAYVSYRFGNAIFWTRNKVRLTKGEQLLTDGVHSSRTRCGNRVSELPQQPTRKKDPPPESFDTPVQDSIARLPLLGSPGLWNPAPPNGPGGPFAPIVPIVPGGPGSGPFIAVTPPDSPSPAPVPEPGTTLLVATGAGACLGWRRKKKKPPCE